MEVSCFDVIDVDLDNKGWLESSDISLGGARPS
eukprot:SAG11_NODE_23691_length_384_cov_1.122807_1_plen_32_part_10